MPVTEDYDIFAYRVKHGVLKKNTPEEIGGEFDPQGNYDEVILTIRKSIHKTKLIGQIMNRLIETGQMDETSYKQLDFVRNGGRSSFSLVKSNMKYHGEKGHPWFRMHQQKYGNIICDMGDYIVLSEKWKKIISKM